MQDGCKSDLRWAQLPVTGGLLYSGVAPHRPPRLGWYNDQQQPAAGSDVISWGESRELICEPRPATTLHCSQYSSCALPHHSFFSRDSVTWFWLPAVWVVSPRQRFCLLPFLGIWHRLSAGHLWYCAHFWALFWGCQTWDHKFVWTHVLPVQPSWGNIFPAI